MEALAIFGIACNVLQVIGSVEQAIKLGRAIYKTGSLDPELERNTDALSACVQDLTLALEGSVDSTSQDTRDLISVAKDCIECGASTRSELQKIAALAPKGSRMGAVRGWFSAAMGGKRRLDKLESTMRARQSVLETRLLVRLCKKSDAAAIRDQANFQSFNSTLQSFILACTEGQTTLQQLIKGQTESVKAHVTDEAEKTRQSNKLNMIQESRRVESGIYSTLHTIRAADINKQDRDQLLASLRYPTIDSRRNRISDPHTETFNWAFGAASDVVHAENDLESNEIPDTEPIISWSNFTEWLRTDNPPQPYWVSGKAGSGKSTLMKFLAMNGQTRKALSTDGRCVKILSHYFWAPGDQLQRNITGFLCSILHQLLDKNHDFCLSILSSFDYAKSKKEADNWSESELEAILRFVLSASHTEYCIFIDGVDEADDQVTLVQLLDSLCNLETVRLCLSSRPEPIFRKKFLKYPSLRMQDLNNRDIRKYARDMLAKSNLYNAEQIDELLRHICGKADGVFLWVMLALKNLEVGTYYEEDFAELSKRLSHLPKGLEELYMSMWNRENEKNPSHQKEASRYINMLLLHRRNTIDHDGMNILTTTLALNPRLAAAVVHGSPECLVEKLRTRCELIAKGLDLRTAGLIEVNQGCRIKFIHRSAYKFLTESTCGREILKADDTAPQERLSNLWCGFVAYLAIRLVLPIKAERNGFGEETFAIDYSSINSIPRGADPEGLRSLGKLSQQYCGEYRRLLDSLDQFLGYYRVVQYGIEGESSVILSLAEALYNKGQWQWLNDSGSVRLHDNGTNYWPDFLGAVAIRGFFKFVTLSMRRYYATIPPDMQVSRRYEDYIIGCCVVHPVHLRADFLERNQLSAVGLMELLTRKMSPTSLERRTLVKKCAILKFLEGARSAEEGCDLLYLGRALLGLFYAKLSWVDNFFIRLDKNLHYSPQDYFSFVWVTELASVMLAELSSWHNTRMERFYCHTNAKTLLILLLSGAVDPQIKGNSLFSELYEAVEATEMPFFLRVLDPFNLTRSLSSTTYLSKSEDSSIYNYSKHIKHAMTHAELLDLTNRRVYEQATCVVTVPGFEEYVNRVLPELEYKSSIMTGVEKKLGHVGFFDHTGPQGGWPPQPYVPIDREARKE
ncbi:hypothetical protein NLG97_g257 [Lecanicillium saksenae]|uniref:Uncharacterized protein n=1 Tax=Lecanicillium saksenae TaxID=468837 RepID=A0ACC1R731_9HYPO|nr:hypothetical protein NLG97_g257 [Lecanicillium saksenae]